MMVAFLVINCHYDGVIQIQLGYSFENWVMNRDLGWIIVEVGLLNQGSAYAKRLEGVGVGLVYAILHDDFGTTPVWTKRNI